MDTPLRALRKKRDLTLVEVASAVGMDPTHLSRIERGSPTSSELAERIVAYFGADSITEEQILYPQRFADRARAGAGSSPARARGTPRSVAAR